MTECAIGRKANERAIQLAKFFLHRRESNEFGRTYPREIRGVAEKDHPSALEICREVDPSLGRLCFKRRGLFSNQWQVISVFTCSFPPSLMCREDGLLFCRNRWVDLGVQEVGKRVDVLLGTSHGRHKKSVWRVRLVLVQHDDEVADVGSVASLE
jgi:hypothetical protein